MTMPATSTPWFSRKVREALRASVQPIIVIVLALVGVLVLLAVTGYDPVKAIDAMTRSVGKDLGGTVRWTTPLILTGVASSLAFRAGVLNIGVDGQIYLGGIFASMMALGPAASLPGIIGIPLVLGAAILGGALWAFIPGILRVRFGADELVTSILLISVASLLVEYLVHGPMAAAGAMSASLGTDEFSPSLLLPVIIPRSTANLGFFLAIAIAIGMAFVFYRTTIGYALKMVGQNRRFAVYGGINPVRTFMIAMVGSGAIGGLVGGMELIGVMRRMPQGFNPGLGFDGIVVALLARNNPIGCIFAAFFFGALRTASDNMERFADTPRTVVQIVQAIVVLAVSAQLSFGWLRSRMNRRSTPTSGVAADELTARAGIDMPA
jgi:general nucleoside transport system permease protein